MKCPYCNREAIWCENKEVYGRNYGKSYMMWLCKPCDAYVGCHNNTKEPLGRLANEDLRKMRRKVHIKIDPFWKDGKYHRGQVYKTISDILGFQFHAGDSTKKICVKVLSIDLEKVLREKYKRLSEERKK